MPKLPKTQNALKKPRELFSKKLGNTDLDTEGSSSEHSEEYSHIPLQSGTRTTRIIAK